ncbi:hypothetical protein PoB_005989900 [Plakobranchus ocellatus]|uniref:Uncharacterized protein n=1 Tax=Plakobranchus ocellatus TaxID=259542 RepID=A0AAV4CKJ0_9GAST|nr:hypothetical protein PoB_005989900 [Plakobranchus ocellatus]
MANYLIMPYAKNNQDPPPGSPMLGLSTGSTLLRLHVNATGVLNIKPVSSTVSKRGVKEARLEASKTTTKSTNKTRNGDLITQRLFIVMRTELLNIKRAEIPSPTPWNRTFLQACCEYCVRPLYLSVSKVKLENVCKARTG